MRLDRGRISAHAVETKLDRIEVRVTGSELASKTWSSKAVSLKGRELASSRSLSDSASPEFPIRERYNRFGPHVVGDVCFTSDAGAGVRGDEGMVFAWCECEWAEDAAEMEVL